MKQVKIKDLRAGDVVEVYHGAEESTQWLFLGRRPGDNCIGIIISNKNGQLAIRCQCGWIDEWAGYSITEVAVLDTAEADLMRLRF